MTPVVRSVAELVMIPVFPFLPTQRYWPFAVVQVRFGVVLGVARLGRALPRDWVAAAQVTPSACSVMPVGQAPVVGLARVWVIVLVSPVLRLVAK